MNFLSQSILHSTSKVGYLWLKNKWKQDLDCIILRYCVRESVNRSENLTQLCVAAVPDATTLHHYPSRTSS